MTQILIHHQIASEVKKCQPNRIAVAYIGIDWEKYIPNPHFIEMIVISPTFGSNPNAIMDLSRKISWDKIFFLDELHAKVFIGERFAIVGSANLTFNGLSGEGLVECCTKVASEEALDYLNKFFDEIVVKAQKLYNTSELKLDRVAKLQHEWNSAVANKLITAKNNKVLSVKDFQLKSKKEFYVAWHTGENEDVKYEEEFNSKNLKIVDEMHFHPDDAPKVGCFILCWKKTEKDLVHRSSIYWLYIHEVYDNAILGDEPYTTATVQIKDRICPPEPFELTPAVKNKFKEFINSKKFNNYFVQHSSIFKLHKTYDGMPELVTWLGGKACPFL